MKHRDKGEEPPENPSPAEADAPHTAGAIGIRRNEYGYYDEI
jgi:hypothetical protein